MRNPLGVVARAIHGRSSGFGWRGGAMAVEPAGEGRTGVPRLGLDRGLAVEHMRGMSDALVALAGAGERPWRRWLYGGGSARRLSPASEVLSARVAYDL